MAPSERSWCVYFVRARGRVLYAGIAKDVEQRLRAHRAGRGAKYLRGRGPLQLVFSRVLGAHGLALRVEQRLKCLPKSEKEALVRAAPSRARLLALLQIPRGSR
jgi:putative endonuclease